MARVHLSNETYYYDQTATASVEGSAQILLDPPHQLDDSVLLPDSLIQMSYSQPGAEMIRLRFRRLNAGYDQFLVEESNTHVICDYRGIRDMYVWTPWIAGDTVKVHVVSTEPAFLGGVDTFSFTIDTVEYFDADLPPTTTTTTTPQTTTTPEITTTITVTTSSPTTSTSEPPPIDSWLSPAIMTFGTVLALVFLVLVCKRRS
jgi:hypothetical protein